MECVSTLSGRQVGLEPTTHGTTIRYSNQLSYNRHVGILKRRGKNTLFLNIRNTVGKNVYDFTNIVRETDLPF